MVAAIHYIMNIPEQERLRIAKIAASKNGLSYPKEKIILIKEDLANGLTYKEIMKKHNVSSKGTILLWKGKHLALTIALKKER